MYVRLQKSRVNINQAGESVDLPNSVLLLFEGVQPIIASPYDETEQLSQLTSPTSILSTSRW